MKIAFVHIKHSGTGGNEKYLNDASRFLAEQGHEVTIVCRRHEKAHHENIKFVVLKSFALGPAHRLWVFSKAAAEHVEKIKYDVVIGLGKTSSQDILRLGAGLVESYHEAAHKYSRSPLQIKLGRDWLKNKLELRLEQKAFKKGNYKHIIANSKMVADDVKRRYGVPDEQISIIYNGVDTQRFNLENRERYRQVLRDEFKIDKDDFVILFLGTNYGLKGLDRALAAMPDLLKREPRMKLLVVGYGKRVKEFKQLAINDGIDSCVIFAGGRRDPEAFYAASNLFLLPTRYDPFANATLEAFASGLPVITTKKNGAHEIINHRVNGSVIDETNIVESIKEEVCYWLGSLTEKGHCFEARELAEKHGIESKMNLMSSKLTGISLKKNMSVGEG